MVTNETLYQDPELEVHSQRNGTANSFAFTAVTPDRWKSLLANVKEEVEDHYWEADGLQMELVEEFIISMVGDSEYESEDSSSSDDSD